jgi:putative sterol carrier protein
MAEKWSYNDYQVAEGLKPGSKHFQYFFNVYKDGEKKCNYCIWIEKEALSRFDQSENYDVIISSNKESWGEWVKGKIDAGDLNNKVLRFGINGQEEINLSDMEQHLSMD